MKEKKENLENPQTKEIHLAPYSIVKKTYNNTDKNV